jgi:hypothetical protein
MGRRGGAQAADALLCGLIGRVQLHGAVDEGAQVKAPSGLDRFEVIDLLGAAIHSLQTIHTRLSSADARMLGGAQNRPLDVRPHVLAADDAAGQTLDLWADLDGNAKRLPVRD